MVLALHFEESFWQMEAVVLETLAFSAQGDWVKWEKSEHLLAFEVAVLKVENAFPLVNEASSWFNFKILSNLLIADIPQY